MINTYFNREKKYLFFPSKDRFRKNWFKLFKAIFESC
jgi:hypothetical protein